MSWSHSLDGVEWAVYAPLVGERDRHAAETFFSDELRERVTGLYGVAPTVDFVDIAQLVDNTK